MPDCAAIFVFASIVDSNFAIAAFRPSMVSGGAPPLPIPAMREAKAPRAAAGRIYRVRDIAAVRDATTTIAMRSFRPLAAPAGFSIFFFPPSPTAPPRAALPSPLISRAP